MDDGAWLQAPAASWCVGLKRLGREWNASKRDWPQLGLSPDRFVTLAAYWQRLQREAYALLARELENELEQARMQSQRRSS